MENNKIKCQVCGAMVNSNSKFCIACGTKIEVTNKFCQVCGNKLNDNDKFCISCGSKVTKENLCPNCGKKLNENDSFCIHCGTKIDSNLLTTKSFNINNLDINQKGLIYEEKGAQRILRLYDDKIVLEQIKNARAFFTNNLFVGNKEIYYSDITGIQSNEGNSWVLGFIQFETASCHSRDNFNSENSWTYYDYQNDNAKKIIEFVRSKMKQTKAPHAQTVVNQLSSADELLKWKQLYDSGVITEEEFNKKKRELLNM